jgi:hypothetical protein
VKKDAPLEAFEQIAEAYPIFRLDSATGARRKSPSSLVQCRLRVDMGLVALSASGVPIGIVALRRLGRLGGLLLEVAASALGIRAVAMVATGTPRRLQPVPRLLLYVEAAMDGLAAVAGFWTWVWRPFSRPTRAKRAGRGVGRHWRWRTLPSARGMGTAWITPVAIGAWMVALILHTARMAIYISPGRGLQTTFRAPPADDRHLTFPAQPVRVPAAGSFNVSRKPAAEGRA